MRRRLRQPHPGDGSGCGAGLSRRGKLHRNPECQPPGYREGNPCRLYRGRFRRRPDQQLRRLASDSGRIRLGRRGLRVEPSGRRTGASSGRGGLDPGWPAAFRAGLDRAGHAPSQPRAYRLSDAGRRFLHAGLRPGRGRRGRDLDRDLPGPAADQVRGQRCAPRLCRTGSDSADFRPGHGGNHGHAAGRRRHCSGRDRRAFAGRRFHGPQLRHRPA